MIKSIRTFIGSRQYDISRSFYLDLGFQEIQTSQKISYFHKEDYGFYLQDYKVDEWINNSMIFLEVDDLDNYYLEIKALRLTQKYRGVKLSKIVQNDWGSEFFLHDPAGVLWHIGAFKE